MHDPDVRLTDVEERIIAAIERHEHMQRSPWMRLAGRRARWGPARRHRWRDAAWSLVAIGTLLLGGGLCSGSAVIGLAGFVLVVLGTSRLCDRVKAATWFPRLINHLFGTDPGQPSSP